MMFVQASTMKWNHISFNQSGCVMGLYSRDQAYLNSIPRLTDNIVISAANRYQYSMSAAAFALLHKAAVSLRAGDRFHLE